MIMQKKTNDHAKENNNINYRVNNEKTTTNEYIEYMPKLIGSTWINNNAFVPLKYLRMFWRFFDLPLFKCEIELDLSCSKKLVISEIFNTPKVAAYPAAVSPITNGLALSTKYKMIWVYKKV